MELDSLGFHVVGCCDGHFGRWSCDAGAGSATHCFFFIEKAFLSCLCLSPLVGLLFLPILFTHSLLLLLLHQKGFSVNNVNMVSPTRDGKSTNMYTKLCS